MHKTICILCGKPFDAHRIDKAYCHQRCRTLAGTIRTEAKALERLRTSLSLPYTLGELWRAAYGTELPRIVQAERISQKQQILTVQANPITEEQQTEPIDLDTLDQELLNVENPYLSEGN